jgi:hypothetical protein
LKRRGLTAGLTFARTGGGVPGTCFHNSLPLPLLADDAEAPGAMSIENIVMSATNIVSTLVILFVCILLLHFSNLGHAVPFCLTTSQFYRDT